MVSHTTHPYDIEGHKPRSKYASWGLLIVRLQWWNPWYIVTGYVEVNVRKDGGVEHPMWLVNDPTSKLQMFFHDAINEVFVATMFHFAQYVRDQPTYKQMHSWVCDPTKPEWSLHTVDEVYGSDIKT